MKYNCKFCNLEFSKSNLLAIHARWCNLNPNRVRRKIKEKHPLGKRAFLGRKHTKETKEILSEKRKKYLSKNKNKHNWSRYQNKESIPEKKFREFVETTDIKLTQYYIPPESDRYYELDFANIENKIAFEVNGNQHYDSDGKLKKYYQERQNYFISLGWKIIEIHYSLCFNNQILIQILKSAFGDFNKCQEKIQEIFNDRIERKKKKIEELNKEKENLVIVDWSRKPMTQKQINSFMSKRKINRPSKEELSELLWQKPSEQIAEMYGVSGRAIEKWAKGYDISKPPRGYWTKQKFLKNDG